MKQIVLVDMMSIVHIAFNVAKKQLLLEKKEYNTSSALTILIEKINDIISTYGKSIICWEGERSLEWRRKIYPLYKKNRKHNEDHYLLLELIPRIKDALNYYPVKQIEVKEVEADDIIYTLSKKYNDCIIISVDKDLIQITNKYNVRLYNPIRKQFVPKDSLIIEKKCIIGDRSDNIPGLKGIGEKTFEKMLENKKFFMEKMDSSNIKIYEKFRKIVDLSMIPFDFQKKILDKENELNYNKFEPDDIEIFFWENNLKELLDRWPTIKEKLRKKIK